MPDKHRQNAKFGFATALTSSALGPSLAVCAAISLPCYVLAVISNSTWLPIILVLVGTLPVLHTLWLIHNFAQNDPRLLQSEQYQLRLAVLESNKMGDLSPESLTPLLGTADTFERNPQAMSISAEVPHDSP